MQTILNFWNGFLAFGAEACNQITLEPGKSIAILVIILLIGFIQDRALKALSKTKFMQYK